MAVTDNVKWLLLDSDLTTRIGGDLPALQSNLYIEANEPGSGEIRLPLDSTAAGLVDFGQYVECEYRGAIRGGFLVDNISETDADANENAGRVLAVSGRGALALLDREIIYSDGTSETTREFTGTKASILIGLLEEAQAQGGLANLSWDFNADVDSDTIAWTDSEMYKLNVGTSLLDIAREFCKTGGFDFEINLVAGVFVLSAYSAGIGSDLTNTIYFRIGANCQEVSRDERGGNEIINAYLYKYKGGYGTVEDAVSIAAHGRYVGFLNIEQAQTSASATTYAAAKLALNKDPKENKSVKVWDGIAPNIFLNYNLGDTISLDRFGVVTEDRILGLQLDFSGETFASVIVDFNYIYYDNDMKMASDLDHLMNQWNTAHDDGLIEVSFWTNLKAKNYINGMILFDSEIYVIGAGQINDFSGVEKYNLTTGLWSKVGQAGLNFDALAIAEHSGDIFIASDGVSESRIYKLVGSTWTLIGTVVTDEVEIDKSGVRTMVAYNGVLYVGGGGLISVDGVTINHHVAAFDISSEVWTSITGTPDAQVDSCRTLVIESGELYGGFDGTGTLTNEGFKKSGGWFWAAVNITNMDGKSVEVLAVYGAGLVVACEDKICIWDGTSTTWTEIGTLSGGTARGMAVAVYLSDIYLGGDFTSINGVSGYNYIAKYSGGAWSKLGNTGATGLNGPVSSLIFTNNDLYIGGNFFTAGGKVANYMAVYYTDFQHALDHLSNTGNSFDMAAAIHNAEASAITDADEMGFWQNVTTGLRKITWSGIKSILKTYLDTLYSALGHTHAGGSGHSIEEEGTPLTARSKLNFVGGGVTVTDDAGDDASVVTVPDMAAQIAAATAEGEEFELNDAIGFYRSGTGLMEILWGTVILQILGIMESLFAFLDHSHDGVDGTSKLAQANTHESPDTDTGTSSLHHTIGAGANQAAAGNHTHANDGWIAVSATWTRTGNHTYTLVGDVTVTYRKDTKVRYKDGGAFEYGVIGSSVFGSVTTVTLITNTDYAMAAATITDTWISYIENPEGFPDSFNWTPTHTRSGTNYTNVPTVQVAQWNVSKGKLHFYEKHTQHATPGGTNYQRFTLPLVNPLAHPQIVLGANFNSGVSLNCLVETSAATCLIEKYDGTAEATASQIYLVEGFYFIG